MLLFRIVCGFGARGDTPAFPLQVIRCAGGMGERNGVKLMIREIAQTRVFRKRVAHCVARTFVERLESRRLLSTTVSTLPFTGPLDGSVVDKAGNVYELVAGAVYEVPVESRTLEQLADFESLGFAALPSNNLAIDSAGNIYVGGSSGIVEFAAGTHALSRLASPDVGVVAGLVADAAGNVYGIANTMNGSAIDVFEVAEGSNSFTSLASTISTTKSSSLALDSSGDLFWLQGNSSIDELTAGSHSIDTVVRVGPTVFLTSFTSDAAGDLYACDSDRAMLELAAGTHSLETLLELPPDLDPFGGPVLDLDNDGDLFVSTSGGGAENSGELFEIAAGTRDLSALASFPNPNDLDPPIAVGLAADAAGNMYCTFSDPFGVASIYEVSGVGFAVAPSAPTIFGQPTAETGVPGGDVAFTAVDASTPAPTVQWQVSTDGGKTFADISSNATARTQTLTLEGLESNQNGTRYRAIFSNSLGSVTTDVVKLAVLPLVLVSPLHASPSLITGIDTTLASAVDASRVESGLTYKWSAIRIPAGAAAPKFSANGDNVASHTIVTFHKAGRYLFRCTITDGVGDTLRSDVQVEVAQTPTSLRLTPHGKTVAIGDKIAFHSAIYDQFGRLMPGQPPIAYSVISGPGTIDPYTGVFSSPLPGAALIEASDGDLSGTAGLQVVP